jgi:hypothetical protein
VIEDPRFQIDEASRAAKWEAILQAGRLQETVTAAIERIQATRQDIDTVLAKVRDAERAGEDMEAASGAGASPHQDLKSAARKLKTKLAEVEKRLWIPPKTKGIVAREDALSKVRRVLGALQSSYDAPTAAQRLYLGQAEAFASEQVEEVNRLFAEEVAGFRALVDAAGIVLLPKLEPISTGEGDEGGE